nr:unnamed protein product [Digitaria exilis]
MVTVFAEPPSSGSPPPVAMVMVSPLHSAITADRWDAEGLLGRLIVLVHAAFLDAGFVPLPRHPWWSRSTTASALSLRYAAPQLPLLLLQQQQQHRHGAAEVAVLRLLAHGSRHLVLYARSNAAPWWTRSPPRRSCRAASTPRRDARLAALWRRISDELCRGALVDMCRRGGVALEPTFMSLPGDAKEARSCRGSRRAATSRARLVAERDCQLWKPRYRAGSLRLRGCCHSPETSWKERYMKERRGRLPRIITNEVVAAPVGAMVMVSPLHSAITAGQWDAERLLGRLIVLVHAAFLDAGFVPLARDPCPAKSQGTGNGAAFLVPGTSFPSREHGSIFLLHRHAAEVAVLRLLAHGSRHLILYVKCDPWPVERCVVLVDALAAAPLLSGGLDATAHALRRDARLAALWRRITDDLCRRALVVMCRRCGVALEGPTFMSLPGDAKAAVLSQLSTGADLASVELVCTALRRLVADRPVSKFRRPRDVGNPAPRYRTVAIDGVAISPDAEDRGSRATARRTQLPRAAASRRSTIVVAGCQGLRASEEKSSSLDQYARRCSDDNDSLGGPVLADRLAPPNRRAWSPSVRRACTARHLDCCHSPETSWKEVRDGQMVEAATITAWNARPYRVGLGGGVPEPDLRARMGKLLHQVYITRLPLPYENNQISSSTASSLSHRRRCTHNFVLRSSPNAFVLDSTPLPPYDYSVPRPPPRLQHTYDSEGSGWHEQGLGVEAVNAETEMT